MDDRRTGWFFVAVQLLLLLALVLLPGGDDWPTNTVTSIIGGLAYILGLAIIAVAALGLGKSLTPTPVPAQEGSLTTHGLYRWVRHPIYTGVLAVVAGITIRSASFVVLAVAAITVVFFYVKASWEEHQLQDRYPTYAAYAAETPRFVPRPWAATSCQRSS